MRKTLALIAFIVGCGLVVASTSVAARQAPAYKTVTVVMHDPGCHSFAVGKGFAKFLKVKGPIRLRNVDEAALKVVSAKGTRLDGVGKSLVLTKGTYRITMVGQEPDDNHLKLVVS